MLRELPPERLLRRVDPAALGFETTADVQPNERIIGQERAVSALEFGLQIPQAGFNMYASGPPGIGKMTTIETSLSAIARTRPTPDDWCYVHNFEDPYRPRVCRLPAGRGSELRQDMQALVEHARIEIPRAFEEEGYLAKRDEIVKRFEKNREEVFEVLNEEASRVGFSLQPSPFGLLLVPVVDGKLLGEEELRELPPDKLADLEQKREGLQDSLKATLRKTRELARGVQKEISELNGRAVLYIVGGLIDDLTEKYESLPDVVAYLKAAQDDIVHHIESFREEGGGESPAGPGSLLAFPRVRDLGLRKYQVNVVVDNGSQQGAPIVIELNPTVANLFGRVEREADFGALHTDFTMIRGGSLHRANGGFLVVSIEDLLREPFAWDAMKRALRTGSIEVEELSERLGFISVKSVKPHSIPLEVKIVLVGRPIYYYLLHAFDEVFPELFKVKADFDTRMPRGDSETMEFVGFLRRFCDREKIRPLDREAVAGIIEHASRLAEDQERLSMHLGRLADLVREANFWAGHEQSPVVKGTHVRKAIQERTYRANLVQERITEMVTRGILLIDTKGTATGQVNGLSIMSLGDISFGKPSRITASGVAGREGLVDIQRQVKMGGPIHSKGVLILNGYLAQKYARDEPLTLSAQLVFEQTYEEVEGDSASAAELFALLSALSGLPIRQSIAVTGSVNQKGDLQAIGGANEKIEGFFDVCSAVGLTGEQGVLIPASNAVHLMLREDVVDAVSQGRFHVWVADSVDEGMELLTGTPAGGRLPDGTFEPGSVNHLVAATLARFAESMRRAAGANAELARP
jgi:predicted ATP-dependent protease